MPSFATYLTPIRSLAALILLGVAGSAQAGSGCPWISATSSSNRGIVDTNAAYWSSVMPAYIQPGTTVEIDAPYPLLRFFNFTVYNQGRMIDYLADADLFPVEGGIPAPNISALPDFSALQYHYHITIRYQDAPAVREPNTLYVGSSTTEPRLLLMRDYLPNPGADATGSVGLPQLTQVNPDGSTIRYDTTSPNLACPLIAAVSTWFYDLQPTQIGAAKRNPVFSVLPLADYNLGNALLPAYSNFNAGYAGLMSNATFGDMLLIRMQMPATPGNSSSADDFEARYLSLCAYRAKDRTQMGCLTDSQLVTQADGYFNVVVTTASNRPALADPADGYNWLPWYSSTERESFTIRQLLPNPDFPGSFLVAGNAADPIAALGSWAPMTTYCDSKTFNANAASGGAALFSACKAAGASVRKSR